MKTKLQDMDIVERVRKVRDEMHREFGSVTAYGEYLKAELRKSHGIRYARTTPMRITKRAAASLHAIVQEVREPAARYGRMPKSRKRPAS